MRAVALKGLSINATALGGTMRGNENKIHLQTYQY